MNYRDEISNFLHENFSFDGEVALSDNDNYFESGFVNSLFAMKLVSFIEKTFNISVEYDDLDMQNFSTINNIVNFISQKKMEVIDA